MPPQGFAPRRFEQRQRSVKFVCRALAIKMKGGRQRVRGKAGDACQRGRSLVRLQRRVMTDATVRRFVECTNDRGMQRLTAILQREPATAANLIGERAPR